MERHKLTQNPLPNRKQILVTSEVPYTFQMFESKETMKVISFYHIFSNNEIKNHSSRYVYINTYGQKYPHIKNITETYQPCERWDL